MASKIRALNTDKLDKDLTVFTPSRRSGGGAGGGGAWFSWPDYEQWHPTRFLGPWDDADQPWTAHCAHYCQIGQTRSGWAGLDGSGKRRAITCSEYADHPDHIPVESCPVCELIAYCEQRGQDVKGLRYKVQWLTNVSFEGGPMQVWGSTPVTIIKKLKALGTPKNKRFGPKIFDVRYGRDMDIIRHGDPNVLSSIEYDLTPCDPSPFKVPDWEEGMKTLSSFIKHYDRELVIKVLEAQVGDFLPVRECFRKELQGGAATAPRTSKRTPARTKSPTKKKVTKKVTKKKVVVRKKTVTRRKK